MTDVPALPRGFTLIELLVTISIAAILLTVAVPNFIAFVQNGRLTNQANDLVTALSLARSEAIKQSVPVSVCSRASNTACAATTNWDAGFLVFVDTNRNNTPDAGEVVQIRQELEGGNTLRANASTRITYQSSGFRSDGFGNDTFNLCDSRGAASGRSINVNAQGRPLASLGAGACP